MESTPDKQLKILKESWLKLLNFFETGELEFQKDTNQKLPNSGFFSMKSKKSSTSLKIEPFYKEDPKELNRFFWLEVQTDDPDRVLLRFLRARKFDMELSLKMLLGMVCWLKSKKANDIKKGGEKSINSFFLKQQQVYFYGSDKDYRPVCYIHSRLHDPKALTPEELEVFCVWLMETARLLLGNKSETVSLVFDLTGMSYSNMDMPGIKFLIHCLEAYFPESLGKVYVLNAPWFFSGIWKMISSLLDPVVVKKIHFINNQQLKEHIDESQIPKTLNPNSKNEFKYVVPEEVEILKDDDKLNSLTKEYFEKCKTFEKTTKDWALNEHTHTDDQKRLNDRLVVKETYQKLDPYIRAKTFYHKSGVIKNFDEICWDAIISKEQNSIEE